MTSFTWRRSSTRQVLSNVFAMLLVLGAADAAWSQDGANPQTNWRSSVNAIIGWQGQEMPDGVLRFTLTPSLEPRVAGIRTLPNLVLDGYAAFRSDGESAQVVVEVVAPDEKVDAVWRVAEASGLEISAIHNHVLLEEPRLKFLHASGRGDPVKLARAVKATLAATGLPPSTDEDRNDADDVAPGLNVATLDATLKASSKKIDGVLEYTFDRPEEFTLQGQPLPAAMGPESDIHFQSLGKSGSVMIAELALLPTEVEKVVQVLRLSDQKVTLSALHNHFIAEEPRLYFLHVAGVGDPVKLAQLMRRAISLTPQMPSE